MASHYDPEERGHIRHRCKGGASRWTDDSGHCDVCDPSPPEETDEEKADEIEREAYTLKTVTARKARKFAGRSWLEIRVGDRVQVKSGFTYEKGGSRTGYFRTYQRISKGPAWTAN